MGLESLPSSTGDGARHNERSSGRVKVFWPICDRRQFCVPQCEMPPSFARTISRWERRDNRQYQDQVNMYVARPDGSFVLPFGEIDAFCEARRRDGMEDAQVLVPPPNRHMWADSVISSPSSDRHVIQAIQEASLGLQLWYDSTKNHVNNIVVDIARIFPQAHIIVIVTLRQARRLLMSELANAGFPQMPASQRAVAGGSVTVTTVSDSDAHDVYHTDLVLVPEPVAAMQANTRVVFDHCPRSRLVALLDFRRQIAAYDQRRIDSVFSRSAIAIDGAIAPNSVLIAPRRFDLPRLAQSGATRLERKRLCIFRNRARNRFIAQLARNSARILCRSGIHKQVCVVVEGIEHLVQLLRLITGARARFTGEVHPGGLNPEDLSLLYGLRWQGNRPPGCPVITTLDAIGKTPRRLFGAVVIAHGLPAVLDIGCNRQLAADPRLLVLDIDDHGDPMLRRAAKDRFRGYRDRGYPFAPRRGIQ